jgi:hypothetical protein
MGRAKSSESLIDIFPKWQPEEDDGRIREWM